MVFLVSRSGIAYFIFASFNLLHFLGCSPAPERLVPPTPVVAERVFLPILPTATAWPTFTPVATPSPTPGGLGQAGDGSVPASYLYGDPTRAYLPTFTPVPDVPVANGGTGVITPSPTIGPTPYGALGRDNVLFDRQVLFVAQTDALPDYLQRGEIDELGSSVQQVPAHAPFLIWLVAFDVSSAPADLSVPMTIRWLSLGADGDALVMHESEVVLTKQQRLFYSGIGTPGGGFWYPGFFVVEILDELGESVVAHSFSVI